DPQAAAAALYDTLHRLDASGARRILAQLPPNTPDWAAVRDRLTRAATPARAPPVLPMAPLRVAASCARNSTVRAFKASSLSADTSASSLLSPQHSSRADLKFCERT
ncbi:MAG: hypothetical protein EBW11_12440, partial [Betaproteobacteria bacterium]|nr:hypothetical protein [Betaproteobacteria bacterium]